MENQFSTPLSPFALSLSFLNLPNSLEAILLYLPQAMSLRNIHFILIGEGDVSNTPT